MSLEQLYAQINALNAEIARLEGEIAALQQDTSELVLTKQAADAARAAAAQAATSLEGALASLRDNAAEWLRYQRLVMETKAQSVLAAATQMTAELRAETDGKINVLRSETQNWLKQLRTELIARIAAISKRLDSTRDPMTGAHTPYENVFISLYELHRDDALTAEEYDVLGLPAAVYDEHMLLAVDFALLGRLLLQSWGQDEDPLSAEEYDALLMTAEDFAIRALSCAGYDLAGRRFLV